MKIDCPHYTPLSEHHGQCDIGKYGGKPSNGTCVHACREHDGAWRGKLIEIGLDAIQYNGKVEIAKHGKCCDPPAAT